MHIPLTLMSTQLLSLMSKRAVRLLCSHSCLVDRRQPSPPTHTLMQAYRARGSLIHPHTLRTHLQHPTERSGSEGKFKEHLGQGERSAQLSCKSCHIYDMFSYLRLLPPSPHTHTHTHTHLLYFVNKGVVVSRRRGVSGAVLSRLWPLASSLSPRLCPRLSRLQPSLSVSLKYRAV